MDRRRPLHKRSIRCLARLLLAVSLVVAAPLPGGAQPAPHSEPHFGVNRVNLAWLDADGRRKVLAQMAASGVALVRLSLTAPFENSLDAVRIADGYGMRILLEIPLGTPAFYGHQTAKRTGFGRIWDMYRLSDIDLDAFRNAFGAALRAIDRQGIVLAGIEPGNELNWGGYNGDLYVYPRAGTKTAPTVSDLRNRPAFEAGLDKYVKITEIVRYEASATQHNRDVKIVAAGAADVPIAFANARGFERVDAHEYIAMLRSRGIERYIDAYGAHLYPRMAAKAGERRRHIETLLSSCGAPGHGKPCWITEWGLANRSKACPLDDAKRQRIAVEVRGLFESLIASGRVATAFYFDWDSKTPYSVWRCNALTPAGRAAFASVPAAR